MRFSDLQSLLPDMVFEYVLPQVTLLKAEIPSSQHGADNSNVRDACLWADEVDRTRVSQSRPGVWSKS